MILALVLGCLPRHAVGQRDELAADGYHVRVRVDAGPVDESGPVVWGVEGGVTVATVRTFRDGSLGRLVVFDDTFPRLGGAVVEVRAFPSGAIVAVSGLGPWSGIGLHGELLDGLWLALTPRVPRLRPGETVEGALSWPVGSHREPSAWLRVVARWTMESETGWSWTGPLEGGGPTVTLAGTASGRVEWSDGRVTGAAVHEERDVVRRRLKQHQVIDVEVTHRGTAPAPRLHSPYVLDDALADDAPLRLADGREVSARPAAFDSIPFLLLDETDPGLVPRIRGTLFGSTPSEISR